MADYLLDSCVLIRHLRRHQPTMDLFAALVLEGNVGIATITRTEIIEGMRDTSASGRCGCLTRCQPSR